MHSSPFHVIVLAVTEEFLPFYENPLVLGSSYDMNLTKGGPRTPPRRIHYHL